jgi:hypothetical protein
MSADKFDKLRRFATTSNLPCTQGPEITSNIAQVTIDPQPVGGNQNFSGALCDQ